MREMLLRKHPSSTAYSVVTYGRYPVVLKLTKSKYLPHAHSSSDQAANDEGALLTQPWRGDQQRQNQCHKTQSQVDISWEGFGQASCTIGADVLLLYATGPLRPGS